MKHFYFKMMTNPGKMVVFLSTQDSVEFHYKLMNHFFGEEEAEDNPNLAEEGDIVFFKLHGEMPQKVCTSLDGKGIGMYETL